MTPTKRLKINGLQADQLPNLLMPKAVSKSASGHRTRAKPSAMRRIAFLFLLFPFALSAQEDCDVFNIQGLAAENLALHDSIANFAVDTIILQPDGSFEVQLSNGTTFTQVLGCTDPADVNYNAAANTDDCSCASACCSIEFDDYTYSVVEIGDQCWFAENLRSENYRNGDAIPSPIDFIWNQTSIGATRVYGESCGYCESYTTLGDACDPLSIEEFGRLYNWYAVTDPREVCPIGWHVSTDADWLQLEIHLGMSEEDASGTGYPRGSNEGFLLKSSLGWHDGANGSDAFGFKGLPAGIIQPSGHCGLAGTHTIFWTPHLSSELNVFGDFPPYNAERVQRQIRSTDEYITRSAGGNQRYGFSVRCVRDAE